MNTQTTIWLLSAEGILNKNGEPILNVPFQNSSVIAGDVHEDKAAVIVDGHEVWTFSGGEWNQEISTDVTLNCVHWVDGERLLIGTASARLAWLEGGELHFIEGFDAIPERNLWMTPWGGPPDTRSLAVSPDGTIYANIHVGWIARSRDGGLTWKNTREGLEMDVHQVATHPSDPAIVFAATARGYHISSDHGETFTPKPGGMPYLYQRACACFDERDVYLVSTSRGPHGQADALLYRSEDAGENWTLVKGLPENISRNIDTFQIIIVSGARALVIVDNTSLYETDDWGISWQEVGHDYPRLFAALRWRRSP